MFGSVDDLHLDGPTIEREDRETHLVYRDEDERVAVTTVQYGPVTDWNLVRMRLSIWHRDRTTVDALAVTIRNRRPITPPPEVYVAAPSADFLPIHFSRDEDSDGRHFGIPDLGEIGTGTITIEWFLRSFDDEWPLELAVDVAYELNRGRFRTEAVEGTVEVVVEKPT